MRTKKPDNKEIEQYDHKDKERVNNPQVGLVTPDTDHEVGQKSYAYDPHIDPALEFDSQRGAIENIIDMGLSAERLEDAQAALSDLKRRQEAYLNWAGKAEHTSFDVTTVSLHVHERIDPLTIIEAVRKKKEKSIVQAQLSFFESSNENPPLREAIEFYKHKHNWSNRLIAGDNLLVMNSLIEKEGLTGKVQMIYIDPPYGIKYGSNFQPFVNKRDVKDGKDEDLTQEPEMVKAFRDTWELSTHSYLTYLRDRLLLVRELLTESGSVFVQISDENLHHVREIMDEVFCKENFCGIIAFRKTGGLQSKLLASITDYILWYCKSYKLIKFNALFLRKSPGDIGATQYRYIFNMDNTIKTLTRKEILAIDEDEVFTHDNLTSQGNPIVDVEVEGKTYADRYKTTKDGIKKLTIAGRVFAIGNTLRYVRYLRDSPYTPINEFWHDTGISGFEEEKRYVVQTSPDVITRCLLMTTDPGDLVLDPTCGSGTTAYVAEQWGRRWITCDTSRVAIALTKQRLMTAVYNYYELAHPEEGVSSGFRYKTVPHITLKSIANNPEIKEGMTRKEIDSAISKYADQETLYDQPFIDNSKVRVTGPFTIEAVPAPVVKPLTEDEADHAADASLARSGETLRQREWRDELLNTGIRGQKGQHIFLSRVEPLAGTKWLHADAETKEDGPRRAAISFGSEYAPLEQRQVALAIEEAQTLVPTPKIIVFAAFQFDPEAAKDIDETNWPGTALLKVQMNADMLTHDLKKKRASNESFWLVGQPDVRLRKIDSGIDLGKYQAEVLGFDYYNTKTGNVESGGAEKIAMWMLDPDYDGRSVFPRQVFFPLAGEKGGWSKLARTLKAEIDVEHAEAYKGTISLPFETGSNKRIAVKIVDDRGIESLKIIEVD